MAGGRREDSARTCHRVRFTQAMTLVILGMLGLAVNRLACIWYYLGRMMLGECRAADVPGLLHRMQLYRLHPHRGIGRTSPTCSVSHDLSTVGYGDISPNTTEEKIFRSRHRYQSRVAVLILRSEQL